LLLKILAETSGNTAARREYYEALKTQLESHAIAEERHFYTHLLEKDATVDLTRHGIAEHHEIDELLGKLDETDMSSPAWLRHLKTLQEKVEHHLAKKKKHPYTYSQVPNKRARRSCIHLEDILPSYAFLFSPD